MPLNESTRCPDLVERLGRFLESRAVTTEGLFRLPGSTDEVTELIREFESGFAATISLSRYDVHTLASVMKKWFRDLPEPVVPSSVNDAAKAIIAGAPRSPDTDVEQANATAASLRPVFDLLPATNYLVLRTLCRLLRAIDAHSDVNKMTAENLLICWAPTIRCAPGILYYGLRYFDVLFDATRHLNHPDVPELRKNQPLQSLAQRRLAAREKRKSVMAAFDLDDLDDAEETDEDVFPSLLPRSLAERTIRWTTDGERLVDAMTGPAAAASPRSGGDGAAASSSSPPTSASSPRSGDEGSSSSSRRDGVLASLLSSEDAFVEKMSLFDDIVANSLGTEQLGLTPQEVHSLQCAVPLIAGWHRRWLRELRARLTNHQPTGDLLRAAIPTDIYGIYADLYDDAVNVFERHRESNARLNEWLRAAQVRHPRFHIDLIAYLLAPLQRLNSYRDLFFALRDATPQDHPEFSDCAVAAAAAESALDHANSGAQRALRRRQAESTDGFLIPTAAAASRNNADMRGILYKQQTVGKSWRTRSSVLKNFKLYLYKSDSSLKPQTIVPIDESTEIRRLTREEAEALPGARADLVGATFTLSCGGGAYRHYVFACTDEAAADAWIAALRAVAREYKSLGSSEQKSAAAEAVFVDFAERAAVVTRAKRDLMLRIRDVELRLESIDDMVEHGEERRRQIDQSQEAQQAHVNETIDLLMQRLEEVRVAALERVDADAAAKHGQLESVVSNAPAMKERLTQQALAMRESLKIEDPATFTTAEVERREQQSAADADAPDIMRVAEPVPDIQLDVKSVLEAIDALPV
jgi:hypothetical protein